MPPPPTIAVVYYSRRAASLFKHRRMILLLALLASTCSYSQGYPQTPIAPTTSPPPAIQNNTSAASPGISTTTIPSPSCATSAICGGMNISYPFWLSHEDQATANTSSVYYYYCGYQGLQLFCQNNRTTILRLRDDSYTVVDIDYSSYTLSLADSDVLDQQCPRVRHNLTLYDTSPLGYDARHDTNLTFFFNCTVLNQTISSSYEVSCLDRPPGATNRSLKSFVFSDSPLPHPPEYNKLRAPGVCDQVVVAPVLLQTLRSNASIVPVSFAQALKGGFKLSWPGGPSGDCAKCESSGGRCGLNQTTSASLVFTCFCPDGMMKFPDCRTTKDKSSGNRNRIVIGSAAAGVITLTLLAIVLFCMYKKKHKYSASSKSLMPDDSFGTNMTKDSEMNSMNFRTHVFTYKELQEATNFFDASKELGDGGFGTVYRGELRDGRIVAVKRLYENSYRRIEQFMNEVGILSQLHHPNLVNLYGAHHSRELLLVYEFVSNGTIADHLHGSRASEALLTWPMRLNIAIETADAIRYLHAVEPPIIHRDIKSNNILLDGNFHVKVADFGLSRLFPDNVTHVSTAPQGTPGYLDPEYHQCYQLTDKSDVYSFGVVLVELISSKPAVDITRHRSEINLANLAINRIQNGEIDQLADPNLGYHSNRAVRKMMTMAAELAFRCLQTDGDMRPPIKEVLEVLRSIEVEGCNVEKEGDDDDARTRDDRGLLKNVPPFSPDSVMHEWVSRSTTPNTSV